jgi:replication initiation and membrane attachment protein DnaB
MREENLSDKSEKVILTSSIVEGYITEELGSEPRHNTESLSRAINEVADSIDHCSYELMELLLANKPIDDLHTHSYGFHTANGRNLINEMQSNYLELDL